MRNPILAALVALQLLLPSLHAQSPFEVDRTVPLAVRDSLVEVLAGVERHAVSFASPKGGRATGFLYRPVGAGPAPIVLYGHGAPGGAGGFATTTNAAALAMQGAVVFVLDAPFARRGDPAASFTPQDSVDQVQLAVDWQRALDWLGAMSGADSTRVAFVGNSYGAAQGALLLGVEPRIRAAVLRVGDGGYLSHFTDPCTPATGARAIEGCLRWEIPEEDLSVADRTRWADAMRPIEPIRFLGASTARILFHQAREDEAVSPARAARLHAAAPEGSVVRWFASGHRLPPEALLEAITFLAGEVGIRPPGAAVHGWLAERVPRP